MVFAQNSRRVRQLWHHLVVSGNSHSSGRVKQSGAASELTGRGVFGEDDLLVRHGGYGTKMSWDRCEFAWY